MSYQYDYFVSYAQKDNEDGFVGQLVEQLVSKLGREKDSDAKPRVFFDNDAVRDAENWTSEVQGVLDASGALVVFLSPNYFHSERCALEFARWVENEERRSLPDSEIVIIQLDDVPGLFDDGPVDVPQELQARFPNWVSELRKSRVSGEFESGDRAPDDSDERGQLRALRSSCFDSGQSAESEGKIEEARELYEKAIAITVQLLEAEPDDLQETQILRALSFHLGDLSNGEGESDRAREYYEKALELSARVVEKTPDDPDALLNLSIGHENLGALAFEEDDLVQARSVSRKRSKFGKRFSN